MNYDQLDPNDVLVINVDDESAGYTIGSISGNTTEAGGKATFSIRLNSKPTSNVTIPVTCSDLSEGAVSPSSITFTSLNWNANHMITVTGVNDTIQDGSKNYYVILVYLTQFMLTKILEK